MKLKKCLTLMYPMVVVVGVYNLCKNIIAISPKRLDIKNEICYTIRAMRDGDIERPIFYKPKDYEQFEKKMTRMIECLDKYIKEENNEFSN